MARLQFVYIAAAAATVTIHLVAFGGLSAMKKPEPEKRTVAVMVSQPKPKQKPKPPEPPKPIEAPKELLQQVGSNSGALKATEFSVDGCLLGGEFLVIAHGQQAGGVADFR